MQDLIILQLSIKPPETPLLSLHYVSTTIPPRNNRMSEPVGTGGDGTARRARAAQILKRAAEQDAARNATQAPPAIRAGATVPPQQKEPRKAPDASSSTLTTPVPAAQDEKTARARRILLAACGDAPATPQPSAAYRATAAGNRPAQQPAALLTQGTQPTEAGGADDAQFRADRARRILSAATAAAPPSGGQPPRDDTRADAEEQHSSHYPSSEDGVSVPAQHHRTPHNPTPTPTTHTQKLCTHAAEHPAIQQQQLPKHVRPCVPCAQHAHPTRALWAGRPKGRIPHSGPGPCRPRSSRILLVLP